MRLRFEWSSHMAWNVYIHEDDGTPRYDKLVASCSPDFTKMYTVSGYIIYGDSPQQLVERALKYFADRDPFDPHEED